MPDHPPSLIHFIEDMNHLDVACGESLADPKIQASNKPGKVTCFACRQSQGFKHTQRQHSIVDDFMRGRRTDPPVKLSGVMAESPEMQVLHRAGLANIVKRGLNSGTNDGEHEALVELAEDLGLRYDDDSESYI